MNDDAKPADDRHPLRYGQFRHFWISRMASALAQNCMIVVLGWQVYETARRTMGIKQAALQLGFVGLAQFLPLLLLVLVAGWAADRLDRRFISRACTALQLLCAMLLVGANLSGAIGLPALFVASVGLGIARAFAMPAHSALAPNLVPPHALPRAIAMNSIAGRIGAIFGPAVGGYLYAAGAATPYIVSAVLFALSLASLLAIPPIARTMLDRARSPWNHMTEGLRYVWGNRLVLGAISLDLFAVLLGGATALLPIFAFDILHVGAPGLGHLRAAPAVGAMAAAIWFSYRPLHRNAGAKMFAAVAVFGVATIIFGISRSMAISLAALVVLGAADMLSVYVRQSLVQLSTPDAMRGRVGSVSSLFISASNELGEAESGFVAALIGPVAAVIAGGAGAIAVTACWWRFFPELQQADALLQPPRKADPTGSNPC